MTPFTLQQKQFTEIYRSNRVRLVRLAYAICGEQRQAEDAVAEAVARVWPRFRDGRVADAGGYLRRAVVNEAVSQGRRRTAGLRALALASDRSSATSPAVDDAVEHQHLVVQSLLRLPAGQRAALALRFLEGLSEAETAATLGVSLGTVKSRVHRGLAALRQGMEEVGADG